MIESVPAVLCIRSASTQRCQARVLCHACDTQYAVCRQSVIEDNPRVPLPEPAKPAAVSDEDLVKEGTVRIIGGDTPARKAHMHALYACACKHTVCGLCTAHVCSHLDRHFAVAEPCKVKAAMST